MRPRDRVAEIHNFASPAGPPPAGRCSAARPAPAPSSRPRPRPVSRPVFLCRAFRLVPAIPVPCSPPAPVHRRPVSCPTDPRPVTAERGSADYGRGVGLGGAGRGKRVRGFWRISNAQVLLSCGGAPEDLANANHSHWVNSHWLDVGVLSGGCTEATKVDRVREGRCC